MVVEIRMKKCIIKFLNECLSLVLAVFFGGNGKCTSLKVFDVKLI